MSSSRSATSNQYRSNQTTGTSSSNNNNSNEESGSTATSSTNNVNTATSCTLSANRSNANNNHGQQQQQNNWTNCNSASAREAMATVLFHGMAHMEQMVPGPFVVLQGTPGDGMANTIDTMPELIEDGREGGFRNEQGIKMKWRLCLIIPSFWEGNAGRMMLIKLIKLMRTEQRHE